MRTTCYIYHVVVLYIRLTKISQVQR